MLHSYKKQSDSEKNQQWGTKGKQLDGNWHTLGSSGLLFGQGRVSSIFALFSFRSHLPESHTWNRQCKWMCWKVGNFLMFSYKCGIMEITKWRTASGFGFLFPLITSQAYKFWDILVWVVGNFEWRLSSAWSATTGLLSSHDRTTPILVTHSPTSLLSPNYYFYIATGWYDFFFFWRMKYGMKLDQDSGQDQTSKRSTM